MRKVIYGGACSLDGFLFRADGALDWLPFSKDVDAGVKKFWANTDHCFSAADWVASAGAGGGGHRRDESYLSPRTLNKAPGKGVERVAADAGGFVVRVAQAAARQATHPGDERRQLRGLALRSRCHRRSRIEYPPYAPGRRAGLSRPGAG